MNGGIMRILRLRSYCEPELSAASHLTKDMNEAYALHGMININYTPMPTRGVSDEIRSIYRKKKHEVLYDGNVIINRFPMFKEHKNPIQRAFRYFCCSLCEFFLGVHEKDIDLVHSSSTPPTQGMLCAMVAKKLSKKYKRHVPFVYNLQDIFPDSLVNARMAKKGSLVWKIGRKIEDYTYRNADKIIVISEGFKKNIMEKGVPEDKIVVIPNWIDSSEVHPIDRDKNTLFDELNIERSKFIVLYAGNLGEAQGADIILAVAKQLEDNKNIQFIVFGGGSRYDEFKKKSLDLVNVSVFPMMPQNRVAEVYSLGDVAIITCKKGMGSSAIPSKTWSIMACNIPIIATFDEDSELSRMIKKNQFGIVSAPENPDDLLNAILETSSKKYLFNKPRDYVEKNCSKKFCTMRYLEVLLDVGMNNSCIGQEFL